MTAEKKVSALMENDVVDIPLMVKEKNISVGKNGKSFMVLLLGDSTGAIDSRLWDRVEEMNGLFDVGDVVKVKGQVQVFQGRRQFIVHKIQKMLAGEYNLESFLPAASQSVNEMYDKLLAIVQSMKNDQLKQLVLSVIQDPDIKPKFLRAPAAKSIHHAWIGGLIEHILSITQIMDFFAAHYSFLNRDLLIFGAIFHDIGKVWELSYEDRVGYTDKGRLLGHMLLACELVDKKASQILGFNEELKDICKHIILAHHGKLEYGSPKRPKCLEALFVAMIDELDSKVSTVKTLIEGERANGEKWSRYSEMFDRYFLLEDLKEKF